MNDNDYKEIERLRGDLAQAQELVRLARMIAARVQNERDEARAEAARLRAALAQAQRADE